MTYPDVFDLRTPTARQIDSPPNTYRLVHDPSLGTWPTRQVCDEMVVVRAHAGGKPTLAVGNPLGGDLARVALCLTAVLRERGPWRLEDRVSPRALTGWVRAYEDGVFCQTEYERRAFQPGGCERIWLSMWLRIHRALYGRLELLGGRRRGIVSRDLVQQLGALDLYEVGPAGREAWAEVAQDALEGSRRALARMRERG